MRKKKIIGIRKLFAVTFALSYLIPASMNAAYAQNGDWDNLAPLETGSNVTMTGDIQAVDGTSSTINVTAPGSVTLNGNNGVGGNYSISGYKDDTTGVTAPQLINNSSTGGLTVQNVNMNRGGGINGGAIGNTGVLNVKNSNFTQNTTQPPAGGAANTGNGGAIYNDAGTVTVDNSSFSGNGVYTNGAGDIVYRDDDGNIAAPDAGGKPLVTINGGAIYNGSSADGTTKGTLVIQNNSKFDGNYASNGAAVYNAGKATIKDSSFSNNKAVIPVKGSTDGNYGRGGAIFNNSGELDINNTQFTGNVADINSGALYNGGGTVTITNSEFTGNKALSNTASGAGGAVGNYRGGTVTINSTDFKNNYGSTGGAVYNSSLEQVDGSFTTSTVKINNSNFTGNYGMTSGGAIYSYGDATVTGSTFENNGASADKTVVVGSGGAIYNSGNVSTGTVKPAGVLTVQNSTFRNNMADSGGAIANLGNATIDNSTFENNGYITNHRTRGGAIINNNPLGTGTSSLTVKNSTFRGNIAQDGGAVWNESTATIENSNFINNGVSADGTQKAVSGGAIYNNGTMTVVDSSFSGNTATSGGAIYGAAGSTTNIKAQNRNVVFGSGAAAPGAETDSIYLDTGATANLTAANNRVIQINSTVSGQSAANHGTVNINQDRGSYGTVEFNGEVTNTDISLYNGTMKLGDDKNIGLSDNLNLLGGTLNTLNGAVNTIAAGAINLRGNTNMIVDVDIAGQKMDNILDGTSNLNYTSGGHINIAGMKSISDANIKDLKILFTDVPDIIGNGVVTSNGLKTIDGPIYKYAVKQMYDNGSSGSQPGEYFVFNNIGNSDNVLIAPIAAQLGGFLVQDNLYRQSFANMDMVMLMTREQRQAMKFRNKYASTDDVTAGLYQPSIIGEERDGAWVRPFANFENVPLSGGPRVSNVSYGALVGGDSDIIDLGHGWDGTFSIFGAYHGSHQAYNGIGIWQNGGSLGAVGVAYKGNFFTGLTANVGASAVEGQSEFGNEHFPMLMTGAAWKSGYNIEFLRGKFILQPSYMMSYTFVNAFDYTNAAGVRITQDPLNVIEIIPGIKLIANLQNGWQPYLGVNMTWNIMDKTRFYANDVALDRLSIDPFVEYGVGLQKRVGDRFTGYGQAMIRNGGRNGVALTMGWRWALGD